jgi:alkylation response protein AidB-like acyl-CoA dehydrogenase
MDCSWSPEQQELKASAVAFGKAELNCRLEERDCRGEFDRDAWKKCGEYGILGMPLPRPYGPSLDMLSVVAALEGLGYGCEDNGLLFSLGAQMWSVQMPIVSFGTEAQKQRYLPGMASGDLIAAHTVSEPGYGSDAFSLRTTAERVDDGYILNGYKTWSSNAPVADVFLIMATVDGNRGAAGLTAFLVDRDQPGLSVPRHIEKMGLRTSTMGEVQLDDCRVRADQVLGQVGQGMTVFNTAMDWERSFILAPYLGTMQRQIERCVRFGARRDSAGKSVPKDEAATTAIVDMHLRLEASRWLTYRAAWMKSVGRRLTREPSEVKLQISNSFVHNSDDALQILGDAAYLEAASIERDYRDSRASKLYSGTTEIQKMIIGRWLGA